MTRLKLATARGRVNIICCKKTHKKKQKKHAANEMTSNSVYTILSRITVLHCIFFKQQRGGGRSGSVVECLT